DGRPREQVRRGRGHHDEIGALAERDVRHLGGVLEHARRCGLAREGLPRGAPDELERSLRGDDAHRVTRFAQLAQQQDRLVRGDAAGDAEDDAHGLGQASEAGATVSSPALISRIAIESAFSWWRVSTRGPTYSSRPSLSWE